MYLLFSSYGINSDTFWEKSILQVLKIILSAKIQIISTSNLSQIKYLQRESCLQESILVTGFWNTILEMSGCRNTRKWMTSFTFSHQPLRSCCRAVSVSQLLPELISVQVTYAIVNVQFVRDVTYQGWSF